MNAYECACADGYSGATCATNIDECAGVDCGGASTCSDGVFEYNCACAAGWEGGGKNKVRDTPSWPTHTSPSVRAAHARAQSEMHPVAS